MMFERARRAFSDMPNRIGFIFAISVLPLPGLAQEQALSGLLSQSVNVPQIAQQFSDDKQFVDSSLLEIREAVIALTVIDEDLFDPQYPQTPSGFADRISAYSEAQSQFVEDYAEIMALRTEALFELWESRNAERSDYFFQHGSLYPVSVPDQDPQDPELPGGVIEVPEGEFPGFPVPDGGFFAQITN